MAARAGGSELAAAVLRQYAIAFIVAVASGIATELAQIADGRDASWIDVRNDVLGALAFLLLFAAFDRHVGARPIGPAATGLACSSVWRCAGIDRGADRRAPRSNIASAIASSR